MPCYQVRMVTVEFKAQNKDLLLEAIRSLGWDVAEENGVLRVRDTYGTNATIDLNNQTAQSYYSEVLNRIKVAYSTKAVEMVAKKKKWLLKKTGENQFVARRF